MTRERWECGDCLTAFHQIIEFPICPRVKSSVKRRISGDSENNWGAPSSQTQSLPSTFSQPRICFDKIWFYFLIFGNDICGDLERVCHVRGRTWTNTEADKYYLATASDKYYTPAPLHNNEILLEYRRAMACWFVTLF